MLADFSRNANGAAAAANGSASGPKRNDYPKILTDSRLFFLFHHRPAVLVEKGKQCTAERDYTPEEACDCGASFPEAIGPGAGELTMRFNVQLTLKACGQAGEKASTPMLKGRYLAQRARAQVVTHEQWIGAQRVKEAVSLGYRRVHRDAEPG